MQFKKGVLDLCILACLSRKDCYGFELVSEVSRGVAMSEGTVYPLLKRLKDEGLVETYLAESREGPPRKYHKLTGAGQARYEETLCEWNGFVRAVDGIVQGGNNA